MNFEWTDAGGGAGGEGGEEGAEGKGGDEAVVLSAEYLEVAAMAEQAAFDVNTSRCSDGINPPIFFALGASNPEAPAHEDCLALVLEIPGVDVNLQDTYGHTALLRASFKGAWRCVKVLLAAPRIDVNLPSIMGRTPLHAAGGGGHTKCVELLLQAPGIKINKVDTDVHTTSPAPCTAVLYQVTTVMSF